MKAGVASETWAIPRSNSSKYESTASFTAVTWNNTIAESAFTLYFELQASDDAIKLGKGIHGKDGTWQAFETNTDALYASEDLTAEFGAFSEFIFQDETFYLTGSERLLNGRRREWNVLLCDADMTPLSLLPMHLPGDLSAVLANHTSPTLKRINETVAVAFQHRNETGSGTEYSSFLYFVDLQEFLPKPKDLGPRQPPEPERQSVVARIIEVIV